MSDLQYSGEERQPVAKCPVCSLHNHTEAKEAEGLVLSGIEAMVRRDMDQIMHVYNVLGAYEAHVAITLYVILLVDVCAHFGQDPLELIADHRKLVNDALAKGA